MSEMTNPTATMPMDDQPGRPQYIHEQHNHDCQQFFGPVTGCIFAMPGSNVTQQTTPVPQPSTSPVNRLPKPTRKPTLPTMTAKRAKMTDAPRELMTFRKKGIHDANINLLFQQMVRDGWIDERTESDAFHSLFSGTRSEAKVIWAGKYGKGTLVFLFRYLEIEGIITVDKGYTIPHILEGHFVDTGGHFLINLDKGDDPNNKAAAEVMEYVRILKYNPSENIRRQAESEELADYDDGYDPYDHQDLHLVNKRGFGR